MFCAFVCLLLYVFLLFFAIGDAAAEQRPRFEYRKPEAESLRRTRHIELEVLSVIL